MDAFFDSLTTALYAHRDPGKAAGMKAYMRHQFAFLGMQKSERLQISDPFIKIKWREEHIDWSFVQRLWDLPEREFQYTALHYLGKMQKYLHKTDIPRLKSFICAKSWWDTVDSIAPLVGSVNLRFPESKKEYLWDWIRDPDFWVRRVSILFQLKYKSETDTEFLSTAILNNCTNKEFFLNKAIGWALREYSKNNPEWVRIFIKKHTLHPLSVREGSKYI
ncbi:MAG: DNA alkylation repair protein [Candidatus Marinimicrobia bacterium]|jgi:3-methyladenine DNA glycosylase AlkD|nr:DNA alkylation repair protein [Candidatus Neomarinimicrobiota bacterium]MDD3716926.1 DNA alkylation repair protein [Candidatus Neomarinimicrobiota bacterium]MDD4961082.1 DNA alkylation repair protein [Candidatus Neomarinimicrobiota bacterium]MDD5710443.1 DNA alkylation repair protein [Candidatus Neomarinimicrobiota bacterium]MDX9777678.1 DNA alkylation repair protein [bacterium]